MRKTSRTFPLPPRLVRTGAAAMALAGATLFSAEYSVSGESVPGGKPFHLGADIEPGSALDVSFLLHRPAGVRGFVSTEGESFVYGDGSPARFWGVNISWQALYPPEDEVEAVARRLAMSGANLVRLTYWDGGPHGIFRTDLSNTTTVDPERLDRLDRFAAALKEQGVYLLLQLGMGRTYLKPDDLPETFEESYTAPDTRRSAYRIGRFFVPEIRDNDRKLFRTLLEHKNPYTGTKWKDEPAIAAMVLLNEDTLYYRYGGMDPETLPASLYDRIRKEWNRWLDDRYGGSRRNLVRHWGEDALDRDEDPARGTAEPPLDSLRQPAWLNDPEEASREGRGNDWNRFLAAMNYRHYKTELEYIRSLGVRQPLAPNAGGNFQAAEMENHIRLGDFFDEHRYHDHPAWGDTMSYGNHSSLERGNGVVKRFAHSRLAGMPFALTEWDYCFPNDWRAEGGPIMAAYASFQDWNLSARFAYWSQTWEDRKKWYSPERGIGSIWRFHNDPAVFGQWPLTALMFLRGDVARGERVIDVGFSETDRFWRERARFPPDRLDFLGDAAFQHRIRLAFFDERYRGDADLAVASGRSSSGDYRSAAAAIAGSGNPVSDLYGLSRDGFRVPRNRGAVISPEAVRQGRGWFERALRENPRIRGELFPSLDRDDGWSVSDTGEIRYHGGDGIFVVDTPRTQGIAGFVGDKTLTTGNLTLEVGNEFATVFFSSLDGAPLNESNRILVTAVGRVQNADFERKRTDRDSARPYEATGETLGNGPIHIQPIRFTAKLTRERSSPPLTAYALDGSGARIEELSLTRQDDAWTLETAPDGPVTIYYEWTTAETAESEGNP